MGRLKSQHTLIRIAGLLSMVELLQKAAATKEKANRVRSSGQLLVNQLKRRLQGIMRHRLLDLRRQFAMFLIARI
jgi:hypothetical protein